MLWVLKFLNAKNHLIKWNSARLIFTKKMIVSPYLVYLDNENLLSIRKELTEAIVIAIEHSSMEVFNSLNNLEAIQNYLTLS